jgi:predicted Ser/Thr protein kinase
MQIALGQRLKQGRFEVLSRLGKGSGGFVYAVKDCQDEGQLALKPLKVSGRAQALDALEREFRDAQAIVHPNLVRLDELFEDQGSWFVTMELVEGTDFLSYVRSAPNTEYAVRETLIQLSEALRVLHDKGIAHCDLKPQNVLVCRNGQVKLLDFGIMRDVDQGSGERPISGERLRYAAPEQLAFEHVTPASDMYSLGVMLYEALTGGLPFEDSAAHVLNARLTHTPTRVQNLAPNVALELASLCNALLERDPAKRPDASFVLRALGSVHISTGRLLTASDVFVGRGSELKHLEAARKDAERGEAVSFVVQGVAGIGKSALLRHFVQQLPDPALVFRSRCYERDARPYRGLDELVEQLGDYLSREAPAWDSAFKQRELRLLPRMFPSLLEVREFADVTSSVSFNEGERYELKARLVRALRELLVQVAARRFLVLVIEDIQWADTDTLDILAELLSAPAPRVLLLCSLRVSNPSDVHAVKLPGELRTLGIAGLETSESAALAQKLAGNAALSGRELESLARESQGHPLYLQELVRRKLEGAKPVLQLTLETAVLLRVSALPYERRMLVEAIAIAGVPTPLDVIARAAGLERAELLEHSSVLRGANLVKGSSTNHVDLYHDRIREVVLQSLDAATRRTWHAHFARALELEAEAPLEQLALHWESAGDTAKAAHFYAEAAARAEASLAFERAVLLYRRSLDLTAGTGVSQVETEKALVVALCNAGHGREAGMLLARLAESHAGNVALAYGIRATRAFLQSGCFVEALLSLREVLRGARLSFPRMRVLASARAWWLRLRLHAGGFLLSSSATQASAEQARIDACFTAAQYFEPREHAKSAVFHAYGARRALALGEPVRAARALCGHVFALASEGLRNKLQIEKALKAAKALSAKACNPFSDALAETASGSYAFALADYRRARDHFAKAEVVLRDRCTNIAYELAKVRLLLGRTLLQLGRFAELSELTGPFGRALLRRNDVQSLAHALSALMVPVALFRNQLTLADNELAEAKKLLFQDEFEFALAHYVIAAGLLDLRRGKPTRVLERLEEQRRALQRVARDQAALQVELAHLRVRAYLMHALQTGSRAALASAKAETKKLRQRPAPAAKALGMLAHAAVDALQNQASEAQRHLRSALKRFDALDMALYSAVTHYVLSTLSDADEKQRHRTLALDYFSAQGCGAPLEMVRLFAPGFALDVED